MTPPRILFAMVLSVLLVAGAGPAVLEAMRAGLAALSPQIATAGHQAPPGETAAQGKQEVRRYTLPPEKYEKAVAYSRAHYRLYFLNAAYGLLVLLLVVGWRVAPKLRDRAERASQRRLAQVVIYAPLLLLLLAILGLPTDIYGHWLSLKYEQSIQGWGSWAWDWTKGQLIALVIETILVWILYGVIRRSPRRWWFYFWLAALPILVFLLFITPVVIEPLFYKFEPLAAKQPVLVEGIEKVLARGGVAIPRERMFEMHASEKLKALDAYVTGLGPSKRVVVWDTTVAKMTTPQTLFVFGHEMGHYVLNHIPKGIAFLAALLLVFLYLGYRGMQGALARWGPRWSIRGVDDWASLPVLLLLLGISSFLASPLTNTFSRHLEHEADVYGLEVVHGVVPDSQEVAAEAFQVLGEVDLADPNPGPFIKVWLYNHPPLGERLVFARDYDPWSKGQAPQFVR